ncbi:hypothetical protein EV702DRAFT_1236239 [Suillus placidus]|uniref:Uncharacterized protein n=1 Tax=Suillus placidus TaxID=48579 RepID=A0A9P6ZR08_9AGAM|nr:hypothetical protein EV702DRAFT_1236239 [Suillus placidus]
MSSDYNFNFPPPSSMFGPGTSAGPGYSPGMPHGMGIGMGMGMHVSGTTGTSNSTGHSMPRYAVSSPPPDFGGRTSASPVLPHIDPRLTSATPGASADGISSHQPSGGAPSKSLKISAVLNDLAIINRRLTHAETLEVQHAQQLRVLEAKFVEQIGAMQRQCDSQLKEAQQAWNMEFESLKHMIECQRSVQVSNAGSGTDEEGMDEELEKDVERMEKSAAAYGDNGLKAVVRMVFQTLMGVGKLTADTLPAYPKDGATWPVDEATKERLLRFRWAETHQHTDNHASITWIFQYIRKNGVSICPASGPALRNISDEDLHDRVVKKYQDLQRNIRRAGTVLPGAETDSTEPAIAPSAPIKFTSRAKMQSRARGKVEVRIRKFNNLPATSEYKDEKYRAALTESLMSPDEDKTGHFISHATTYRSTLMSQFLEAVDDTEDPSPPATGKYTVRMKGEARDLPLVAAKKIENCARRWMVSSAWLALPDNKKFDAPSYILDNGRAWGDAKDPEEILAGQKRVKEEKRLISSRKRVKIEAMEEKGKMSAKARERLRLT